VVVVLQFAGTAVLLVLGVLFSIAAPGIGEDVAARRKSVWGDGLLGRSQAAGFRDAGVPAGRGAHRGRGRVVEHCPDPRAEVVAKVPMGPSTRRTGPRPLGPFVGLRVVW